jgi:SAM-dependent methyltransferase
MRAALQRFFVKNQKICTAIERKLPAAFTRHLFTSYKYLVSERIDAAGRGLTVLDVGGGKECPYYEFTKTAENHDIVAVDIDETEIRRNVRCHLRVVADAATGGLPFGADSADLITSRSVIEHLRDNRAFLHGCRSVLRPGGLLIHTFPCRFSPFALINKALPDRLARLLLYYFHPEWRDVCGFKVYYDHCSYHEMRRLLDASGYELVRYELRYYQAIYYDFFVPFYLIMLLYDLAVWWADVKLLSCQMLFIARKRATPEERTAPIARSERAASFATRS